jgi:hypothetical protein
MSTIVCRFALIHGDMSVCFAGCGSNDSPVPSGRGLHCVHHDHPGRSQRALHGESTQSITFQAHQGSYLGYVALLFGSWNLKFGGVARFCIMLAVTIFLCRRRVGGDGEVGPENSSKRPQALSLHCVQAAIPWADWAAGVSKGNSLAFSERVTSDSYMFQNHRLIPVWQCRPLHCWPRGWNRWSKSEAWTTSLKTCATSWPANRSKMRLFSRVGRVWQILGTPRLLKDLLESFPSLVLQIISIGLCLRFIVLGALVWECV